MLAILNSLNAHNFPIFQPILMILVSKCMFYKALSYKTYLLLGLLSPLKENYTLKYVFSYLALKISEKGVGMYLGTLCYGYVLNLHLVYLAIPGTRLLCMKKQNLFVLIICNRKKRNSNLFK